ncbi:hypothetical protein D9758_015568 [Tetrapyrgos nigripes]|uniref:Uncharacterized protein n=1 Tax=Tetrapyrgos nigripes TaxID=182062 RepID=A0A8H5CDM5_9AGAR|nr:hypothetical protein D9758_015568 [Tetrapyrgos nigripes]
MKKEQAEKEEEQKKSKSGPGLGLLVDYGDSDGSVSDDRDPADDIMRNEEPGAEALEITAMPPPLGPGQDDEAAMQARRARAKEWVEKRRALG